MARLDDKVAFITGVARGQGRSHAIRLAQEGADIIGVDLCGHIESVPYAMATKEDLDQTVKEVEALGRRIFVAQADVRDYTALKQAFHAGVTEIGPVDIVLANAGIGPGGMTSPEQQWNEVIAVNLTGVWNTGRVAIPSMVKRDKGGAIVLTSSTGGLQGVGVSAAGMLGYTAAKHGVIGLMRSWANYLAPHFIRVNVVAPTTVRTPMARDGNVAEIIEHIPELASSLTNAIPVEAVDPIDVSNAILWLVSDEARYITGSVVPVDAGQLNKS